MAGETAGQFRPGTVVTSRRHGSSGTVTRTDGDGTVYVAWHGTCVESDELCGDLEIWEDPPPHLAAFRGAVGVIDGQGRFGLQEITAG